MLIFGCLLLRCFFLPVIKLNLTEWREWSHSWRLLVGLSVLLPSLLASLPPPSSLFTSHPRSPSLRCALNVSSSSSLLLSSFFFFFFLCAFFVCFLRVCRCVRGGGAFGGICYYMFALKWARAIGCGSGCEDPTTLCSLQSDKTHEHELSLCWSFLFLLRQKMPRTAHTLCVESSC